MNELSIWLDSHCKPSDLTVFKSVAALRDASVSDTVIHVSNGEQLLAELIQQPPHSIDHLVIAGHGGPTWLLDDEYGVTTGAVKRAGQVGVWKVAECAAPILTQRPLISLAACLCSRSPTWLLRQRLGRNIGSDWGPRAYLPGGQASLSARLRDYLHCCGCYARVRGHRAAGHASMLALLAEHGGSGGPCETLFGRCFPGVEPTLGRRRWWVRNVTGLLAQRWLMGDDTVVWEIRRLAGAPA